MNRTLDNLVELKVPVNEDYVSVVRLLVSGLGNRLGLPVNELENLKLMIGEAFLTIVAKAEQAAGLVNLKWKQDGDNITVSISDPTGKHKSLTNAGNLALLKTLGGDIVSSIVDGVDHLDLNFEIKYRENRPYLFHDRPDGKA